MSYCMYLLQMFVDLPHSKKFSINAFRLPISAVPVAVAFVETEGSQVLTFIFYIAIFVLKINSTLFYYSCDMTLL